MSGSAPLIEADGVGRRAPGQSAWLLHHVSIRVAQGERVAVTGPSGSGKSLLLRALALLDSVDEGEIRWRGAPVEPHDVPTFRSRAIYLQQRPTVFAGSVAANLRCPFELGIHHDRSWDRTWAEGVLDEIDRDPSFLNRDGADLSGGEAQIVAFLRALQLDPDLLLLDEPTAALDETAATAIERLVDRWYGERGDERGLVWVSHDASQAKRTTEREVRLEVGRIRP